MTPERIGMPLVGALRPYYCDATNPRTGHPCRTVLIQAWAPSGALVRRRCKQCGAWSMIRVCAEDDAPVL